jgi:hypothetical protein
MPTSVHVTRKTAYTNSDRLREDRSLYEQAEILGAWLELQPLPTLTMEQVLAFARTDHADAELEREPTEYVWLWDDAKQTWMMKCITRGTVAYVTDRPEDPILLVVEISATY